MSYLLSSVIKLYSAIGNNKTWQDCVKATASTLDNVAADNVGAPPSTRSTEGGFKIPVKPKGAVDGKIMDLEICLLVFSFSFGFFLFFFSMLFSFLNCSRM